MADGSVVFNISADDKEAQKKLNQLHKDIEKTAQTLNKAADKKSGITTELSNAREEAKLLQDELDQIAKQKAEAEATYSANSPGRARFAAVDPVAYEQARQEIVKLNSEQEKVNAKLLTAQKNVSKLESEEAKVTREIELQNAKLEAQKDEAGMAERMLSQGGNLPQLKEQISGVTAQIKKSARSILKWGFGIRSAFVLFRRLRSALKEGVSAFAEQDEQTKTNLNGLKSSLSALKASWGAAFAPIINAVVPLLQSLVDKLIDAANAVQAFFAALFGAGSYHRVVKNNNALADSYGGAGGAAADAKKQIMGFDEINKLNGESGGGGGGGAGKAWDTVEEEIDNFGDSLLGRIILTLQDIFIDTSGWNSEKFAEIVVAALGGLLGWFLAASLGLGAGGVILLTIGGIILGLAIDGLIFDHDKKLSKREVLDLITLALTALVGGIIGFKAGGKLGAALGITIGVALWLSVKDAIVKNDSSVKGGDLLRDIINVLVGGVAGFLIGGGTVGAAIGVTIALGATILLREVRLNAESLDRFNQTALGQTISRIKDKLESLLQSEADLKVHINSITGEIDERTQANLSEAKALIDSIFTLNDKENLTSTEAEILREQIELLNGLGLDGIKLEFDETTGHVTQTREQVAALYDEIVKQYQLEAMHDAYVSAYQDEFNARRDVERATTLMTDAQSAYNDAVSRSSDAYDQWQAAKKEYESQTVDLTILQDEYDKMGEKVRELKQAYVDSQAGVEEAKTAMEQASETATTALENYDLAYDKLDEIIDKYAEVAVDATTAGEDVQKGFADGMKAESHQPVDESIQTCNDLLDAIHTTLDEHSPSQKTKQSGENVMEGLAIGIESKRNRVLTAVRTAMQAVVAEVSSAVMQISRIWQSDWGKPHIRIPIFQLFGNFDFMTGRVPQINVAGWRWLAKGGILDKATLIGAGEAGKEAIVPLERNTEWIDMVVNGLLDRLSRSPVVNGSLIPPRAVNGSMFSDTDIDRLARGIASAFTNGEAGDQSIKLYLDGRQIAETVTKHQRRIERGYA